jgi:zinc-binding alcohol dehydrogenase family protein
MGARHAKSVAQVEEIASVSAPTLLTASVIATKKHLAEEVSSKETMQAFGIRQGGSADVIEEMELPKPVLRSKDILVRVEACAMNPVDTKLRNLNPGHPWFPAGSPKVLGWDGSGVVAACGPESVGFSVGDRVFFAGSHIRNGTNADLVAVDSRIVGKAPRSIAPEVAASVPLVALTAWEGLEQLGLDFSAAAKSQGKTILVIPGAGGVGSYIIQLAKVLGLTVIATASRPESREACLSLGADYVINHRETLKPQLESIGINEVHFIYDAVSFEQYATQFLAIIRPFGKIVSITGAGKADIDAFKSKAVSYSMEFMFSRPQYEPDDIAHQSHILNTVSQMIDSGNLQTPIWKSLPWSLESLREMHRLQESGKAIGKIVMAKAA